LSPLVGESGITDANLRVMGALAYSTIGVAFISYLAWYWLIVNYPATKLSGFSFLARMIGVLAGGLLLGEPLSPALWAALALVALGIYLINRRPRGAAGATASEHTTA
jgi:drug/metabolite transporter (DMT)-like permease